MFSALRIIVIVGVIFYLSPVRQGEGPPARMHDLVRGSRDWSQDPWGPSRIPAPTAAVDETPRLQSLWQALPDSARKAVVDEVVELGTGGLTARPAQEAAHPGAHQPTLPGEARKRP
jgi:hypothetical protein